MPLYKILNSDKKLESFRATELSQKYNEKDLEDWFEANPEVLVGDEPLLVIGRQVNTPVGIVDLLALDSNGSGIVIELKRAPNQREAVGQSLEYASWLSTIEFEEVLTISKEYLNKSGYYSSLKEKWKETFGSDFNENTLNNEQRIFIVIEGEDNRIASMVKFLRSNGVEINLLNYNFYRTNTGEEILYIDTKVGETEAVSDEEVKPSETRLLKNWSPNIVKAYKVFKEKLVSAGLYSIPKKSGMSFSVQTSEGTVFVCFFKPSDSIISVWLRNDSLQQLIDFDEAAKVIELNAPENTEVKHQETWFVTRFRGTPENANRIAGLILTEVVRRLLNHSSSNIREQNTES